MRWRRRPPSQTGLTALEFIVVSSGVVGLLWLVPTVGHDRIIPALRTGCLCLAVAVLWCFCARHAWRLTMNVTVLLFMLTMFAATAVSWLSHAQQTARLTNTRNALRLQGVHMRATQVDFSPADPCESQYDPGNSFDDWP